MWGKGEEGKGRRLGCRRQTETKFDLLLHLEVLGFLPVSLIRNSLSYLNTDSPLVPVTPAFIPRKNGRRWSTDTRTCCAYLSVHLPASKTACTDHTPPRPGPVAAAAFLALREDGVRRLLSLLVTVDRRGGRVSGGPWADPDPSCHPPISRLARSRFAAFNQDFSYVLLSRQLIDR